MNLKESIKKFWKYLQKDTWDAWLVSLILIFILIKFILFPLLTLITGSSLPLVVVESCSMYHESGFDNWWIKNSEYYESLGINKSDFEKFPIRTGLNKGDIVVLQGHTTPKIGDIIVFSAGAKYPLIHRVVTENPFSTKGDHNTGQLSIEKEIEKEQIIGKAIIKIPLAGWIKLIFFEPLKPSSERGLCK